MFIVVAVQAEQFPVAAVGGVVVVIVVAVMDRKLLNIFTGELAPATSAYPGVELEGLGAVILLARLAVALGVGDYFIEPVGVGLGFFRRRYIKRMGRRRL